MKLSRSERILLDFITEEMDENNMITNSIQTRGRFNELLTKIGQDNYSDSTIQKCFTGLVDHHFLEKVKGRGLYQVSPLFFFKGTEEERVKAIRKNLESINKEAINKYRYGLIIRKSVSSSEEPPTDSNA